MQIDPLTFLNMQTDPFIIIFFYQLLTKILHIQENLSCQIAHLRKFKRLIYT